MKDVETPMIDALANAPQASVGFAKTSPRTIAIQAVCGEWICPRLSILRSGSESHTDWSIVTIRRCRTYQEDIQMNLSNLKRISK